MPEGMRQGKVCLFQEMRLIALVKTNGYKMESLDLKVQILRIAK